MGGDGEVREDMTVVGPDQQTLGTVEYVHGDGFDVKGLHLPLTDVASVEGNTVQMEQTERVHLVEHRLEQEDEHGVRAPLGE